MGEIFPYISANNEFGETGFVPSIPIHLSYREHHIRVNGLIDTGAAVNVMPYSVGKALGATWDESKRGLRLAGNLGRFRAQAILVQATIASFTPVELAFAWTEVDTVPLLLGQVNFLMAFDICIYRSRLQFEISPKSN
jgi:hypothetical protein